MGNAQGPTGPHRAPQGLSGLMFTTLQGLKRPAGPHENSQGRGALLHAFFEKADPIIMRKAPSLDAFRASQAPLTPRGVSSGPKERSSRAASRTDRSSPLYDNPRRARCRLDKKAGGPSLAFASGAVGSIGSDGKREAW